jgi:hypothetical protein
MSDSPYSTVNGPAVEPDLPMEVRLEVARLAGIPAESQDEFCDLIQCMRLHVCALDRRTLGNKPGDALVSAADAARALHEAFERLNPDDLKWVEQLLTKTPRYNRWVPALPRSVNALSDLFSIAVGKAPLWNFDGPSGPDARGRRRGDVKNLAFRELVRWLRLVAEEWCGGKFTFDINYEEKSSLTQVLEILRRYFPQGVVPDPLPLSTIERIISDPVNYNGFPDIDLFRI